MRRYWVSWWTEQPNTEAPFGFWISGWRYTPTEQASLCAAIDASSCAEIWRQIRRLFPDYELRFCEEVTGDWQPPADRFGGVPGPTSLSRKIAPSEEGKANG